MSEASERLPAFLEWILLAPRRRAAKRAAKRRALAERPPIMAGYRQWDAGGVLARHRKTFLTLLFFVSFFYFALFNAVPRALTVPLLFPLVALYLVIVWALPVREYTPSRWLEFFFWGYFGTLLLWPNYLALDIPGLPWITVARLFGAPMVVLLLLHTSNCGPFRREMKEQLGAASLITKLVAWFAVVQVLSVFSSSAPFETINRMINNQIVWTGVFFVAVWVFRRETRIETWIRLYPLIALVLCVIGVVEARKGGILWANSIPSFLAVGDEQVQRLLAGVYRLGNVYRVVATSTTPLSLAEALGATTPFLLYLMVQYRNPFLRLALLALDVLLVYVILLTDSRLGLVGMLVGHAAYAFYLTMRIYRFHTNSLIRATVVAVYPAALVAVTAMVLFVGRINNAVIGDGRQTYSDQARATQISDGLVKVWESPLFGFGTGQGAQKLGFTNAGGTLTIDTYYISILLDYGIVGFLLFYSLIVAAIIRAFSIGLKSTERANHQAIAFGTFLLIFLTTKAVLSQEANHPLIFMALAAIVSLSYATRELQLVR